MKFTKLVLCLVLCAVGFTSINAQHRCGTDEYMQEKLKDPVFAEKYYKQQEELLKMVNEKSVSAPCTNPLIIPVAVHYYNGITTANTQCLIDAALAQVDQMNLDFRSCNANAGDLCTWIDAGCNAFGGNAGANAMPDDGACIQFCLADQNLPAGEDNIGGYGITVGDYSWTGGTDAPLWAGCLNLFVDPTLGALGIATFGGNNPTGNGVVVQAAAFGAATFSGCSSGANIGTDNTFSNGATATHEVGHYFSLEHTFSDNLGDTPPQNNPNYGCPTVNTSNCTSTAGSPIDYSANFMDYVDDDCMSNFSDDQVTKMLAFAASQGSWATNMISCWTDWQNGTNTYSSCVSGPCGGSVNPPTASFTVTPNPVEFCSGQTASVSFTDTSTDNPTSWSWTFSGVVVSPATSTDQNPTVTVSSAGTLVAELIATNGNGSSALVSQSITVTELAAGNPACQTSPCLDFDGGPYVNFYYGDGCIAGCPLITGSGFEVWENEAYVLAGLKSGVDYTFEFCTNYDEVANWAAVITVGQYDIAGQVAVPGSEIAFAAGCTLTFTCPSDGDYIVVISGDGNCGGAENQTDNGIPTFTCVSGCPSVCGDTFTDRGGANLPYTNNENNEYTICPDDPACEVVEIDFTSFDIEANATCSFDVMSIYDGSNTAGTLIDDYCGTNTPGVVTATDASGCLTVVFTSDQDVVAAGWEALVACVDNGNCTGGCPDDYTGPNQLTGTEDGTGGVNNDGVFETDGTITSIQTISGGTVVYDSGTEINLNGGFEVILGAVFDAYIDGCDNPSAMATPAQRTSDKKVILQKYKQKILDNEKK